MHYSKIGLKKMAECPNCGRKNPSDWPLGYCRSCGKNDDSGITYGENSRPLWADINRLKDKYSEVWEALYSIGCKMQELERKIEEKCDGDKFL